MSTWVPQGVMNRWLTMKAGGQERQRLNREVSSARKGDFNAVMPGVFPTNWPKPVVANMIDVTARDLAEVLARMPTIDCSSSEMTAEVAKKRAAKRTKMALYYIEHSRLKLQLQSGCDWFWTFSAMPIIIEPDFDAKCPRFRVDDPRDAFWQTDFYGNVITYAKQWTDTVDSLCAKFPDLAEYIDKSTPESTTNQLDRGSQDGQTKLDVVQMHVGNRILLFLPEREGLMLNQVEHRLDRPPVVIAERPKWDEQGRGQFDDVMWVWLARARMAVYGLEAAEKAVRAPLAVPDDVSQVSFGGDSIIRTNDPDKVRRVPIELPQSSLIESEVLDQEIADGSRVPAARRGNVDASIITGQGVEALQAGFSTQLATAQEIVGDTLRRAVEIAFEIDETYWPDLKKTINGHAKGTPYTETYTPIKDINGDYSVSVTYGMTAGMDPNRAIVFLLQLRADQSIDRDTMQRMLPFEIDVDQLQRKVDIEQTEDALKQGLFALLANAPMMGEQGMDPLKTLQRAAEIVKARENGTPIHEAILEAFKPTEEEQQAAANDPMAQMMEALGGGGGGGGEVAPGDNAHMGPGASPDISQVLAGLTPGGRPNLQANVSRQHPA